MAGEWLLNMLNKRGGSASDYSDVVFGKVMKENPLTIQYSNEMMLTEDFLLLSQNVTDYEEIIEVEIDGSKKKQKIKHLNALKKDDKVVMIRGDGGQDFYVVERIPKKIKDEKEVIEWLKKN